MLHAFEAETVKNLKSNTYGSRRHFRSNWLGSDLIGETTKAGLLSGL